MLVCRIKGSVVGINAVCGFTAYNILDRFSEFFAEIAEDPSCSCGCGCSDCKPLLLSLPLSLLAGAAVSTPDEDGMLWSLWVCALYCVAAMLCLYVCCDNSFLVGKDTHCLSIPDLVREYDRAAVYSDLF